MLHMRRMFIYLGICAARMYVAPIKYVHAVHTARMLHTHRMFIYLGIYAARMYVAPIKYVHAMYTAHMLHTHVHSSIFKYQHCFAR